MPHICCCEGPHKVGKFADPTSSFLSREVEEVEVVRKVGI